jgi:hypothetical protein
MANVPTVHAYVITVFSKQLGCREENAFGHERPS